MKKLKMMPPPMKKRKVSILTISIFVVLCVYFFSLLIPFIWATYSAFNDPAEYNEFYTFHTKFPTSLTFENFRLALGEYTLKTDDGSYFTFFGMILSIIAARKGLGRCMIITSGTKSLISFFMMVYA